MNKRPLPEMNPMRLVALAFLAGALVFFTFALVPRDACTDATRQEEADDEARTADEDEVPPGPPSVVQREIGEDDTLSLILSEVGIDDPEPIRAAGSLFADTGSLPSEGSFVFHLDGHGRVTELLYPITSTLALRLSRSDQGEQEWISRSLERDIVSGDTLSTVLAEVGIHDVNGVLAAAMDFQDLSEISPLKSFLFEMDASGEISSLSYPLDLDQTLIVRRSDTTGEGWSAEQRERIFETRPSRRDLVIAEGQGLWHPAEAAGLEHRDIVGIANVYRFDIDFNTEVRAGATAAILMDELWENGEFVRLGPPAIARFTNAGESYLAIRYTAANGETDYYDDTGLSRQTAFLRSPLRLDARVTSAFDANRFHPVLQTRRPHNGTDFGAPTGTPVYAVGDGVVIHASTNGGHGLFVKIDHPGPYHSSYSHLSRIRVSNGERVEQGQLIGNVGSTGMSTGPHLHYQFWVNGSYVDPMSQRHARTERLPASEMEAFRAHTAELLTRLDSE